MVTAERYAAMILANSQQAVRSVKETIQDVVGRTMDDALRLETINYYSSLGDFSEARERLAIFYGKK
jgi:enoyl-CoA hydratase